MSNLRLEVVLAAIDKVTAPFKNITNSTKSLTAILGKNQQKLKELQNQQAKVDAYRKANLALRDHRDKLEAARQKATELGRVYAANPTGKLKTQLDQATTKVRQLTASKTKLEAKLLTTRTAMQNAGISASKLATSNKILGQEVVKVTANIQKQEARLKKIAETQAQYAKAQQRASQLQGAGFKMGAMGAGITAGVGYTIKEFAQIEDASAMLQNALMDKSGAVSKYFDAINQKAIMLGETLPGTNEEFINTARALIEQGMIAQNVINGGLQTAGKFGVLMRMNGDEAAVFISKVQEAHGIAADRLEDAADSIQRARFAFGLETGQIYEAMKYVAPDLEIKGIKGNTQALREYLAVQGMAAQVGLEGSSFGTGFGHFLKKTAVVETKLEGVKGAEGVYIRKLLEDKDIKLKFFDGKGNFKGIKEAVTELEKLKVLSNQDQERVLNKMFDTEGARVALIMMSKGVAGFDAANAKMEEQASLQQRIDNTLGTLKNRWEELGGATTGLVTTLGGALQPVLVNVMDKTGEVVRSITAWAKEHPQLTSAIMKSVAVVGILLVIFGTLFVAIGSILVPLAALKLSWVTVFTSVSSGVGIFAKLGGVLTKLFPVFGILKTGIISVGRAFLMNPIGLAIVAIVAGLYLLWRNWDAVKNALIAGWNWIDNLFRENPILNFIFPFIGAARALINNWDSVKTHLLAGWLMLQDGASAIWGGIKAVVSTIWLGLVSYIRTQTPLGYIMDNWGAIKKFLSDLNLMGVAQRIMDDFLLPFKTGFALLRKMWDGLNSLVPQSAQNIFNGPGGKTPTPATVSKPPVGGKGFVSSGNGLGLTNNSISAGRLRNANTQSNNKYEINISAQSNASPVDIGREVRQAINQIDQQKARDRRVSMRDKD